MKSPPQESLLVGRPLRIGLTIHRPLTAFNPSVYSRELHWTCVAAGPCGYTTHHAPRITAQHALHACPVS